VRFSTSPWERFFCSRTDLKRSPIIMLGLLLSRHLFSGTRNASTARKQKERPVAGSRDFRTGGCLVFASTSQFELKGGRRCSER
jgi:hypothetical protein